MQIILYEEKNFQGHHYDCVNDCPNMNSYIRRCNSVRVISGSWIVYECTNYKGYQYFLKRGEYPEFQDWMGFNDSIRSCIAIPQYKGSYRLRLYERNNFGGKMLEAVDDCPSVFDRFNHHDIQSCNVFDGYWIFYELPNYKGRQYCLRPGEYRRFSDWGALNARVGSFKKITEFS
ncbi:gamma-crystallin M2-like [Bufo gargarizans]|uniref:gamma-crystallin M2-like n=1 Tax=Bufo bufo TaxID=8384 RepID=UPI001ABEC3DE|nr:gamma-crystallin M2-like [Bufo bufo]XP_044159096.1 gamma-crystallin M2-like [Bufo gargarizans]